MLTRMQLVAGGMFTLFTRGLAFWLALRSRGRLNSRTMRLAWGFLAAALAIWLLGDLWVVGTRLLTGASPTVPSVANLLYLAGYFAMVGCLAAFPAPQIDRFIRLRALLDVVILAAALMAVSWLVFVQPVAQVGMISATTLTWLAQPPVFDLILLSLCMRQLLLNIGRRAARSFALLGAGLSLLAIADLAASYNLLLGDGGDTLVVAAALGAGNLLMGYGAHVVPGDQGETASSSTTTRLALRLEALLPVILTYVVVGFTLFNWWVQGEVDRPALAASVVLSLLLVARQGVILGQRELRRHTALVNATGDLAFIARQDGQVELANPALRQALGIGQEAPAPPLQDFLMFERMLDDILRRSRSGGWSGEAAVLRPDGVPLPVSLTLNPVPQGIDAAPMLAGVAHDLTDIKEREVALRQALADVAEARAELLTLNASLEDKVKDRTLALEATVADLARLNEELKALDQLKTEFVSLVSHELRAPLTNIRTGIELLLGAYPDVPDRMRESLALVNGETRRLSRFVETILDVSALEAGHFGLQLGPVDVERIARLAAAGFPEAIAGGRIQIASTPAPAALADESALQSVFFHLLDNALKYASSGPVEVSYIERQPHLEIAVRDHGPGIPEDELQRVFDIFHRLDSRDAREVYGHGLGLHLVRRLLLAMGGDVRAEAAEGGGLRMVLWLPLANEAP
jgi:signal transduction histidine kinase